MVSLWKLQDVFLLFTSLCISCGHWVQNWFPQWLSSKGSACNIGDSGDKDLIPGWGRSAGGWSGHPLQYSCLEKRMDRGAWQTAVCESQRVGHDGARVHASASKQKVNSIPMFVFKNICHFFIIVKWKHLYTSISLTFNLSQNYLSSFWEGKTAVGHKFAFSSSGPVSFSWATF